MMGKTMEPILRRREDLEWIPAPLHEKLYQRSLLSSDESKKLNLHLWQILREKIEPGGTVLPHTHDVTEVIYFIQGEVNVLLGDQRTICKPGDTIVAPAGVIHGVANRTEVTSGQISFFIPEAGKETFGHTELAPGVEIIRNP